MSAPEKTPSFWARWGPALVMMGVIFALSSIPSDTMPNFGDFDLSVKKLGHMMGYAFLSQAYLHGLGRERPSSIWMAWILAVLYASSDEFHQSFVPGRGSTVIDVGIDAIGAFLGLLPSIVVARRKATLLDERA